MRNKNRFMKHYFFTFILFVFITVNGKPQEEKIEKVQPLQLSEESAQNFSQLALHCIQREYPNKLSHVMNDSSEVKSPAQLHPVFYGCFDWHSSVHGHWMLVRLLKLFPGLPNAGEIRSALDKNLTKENIWKEVEYLNQNNRKSFERTYGWSWLLKLAEELYTWDDPDGGKWYENLLPLTENIKQRYVDFLPKQTYPIRRGVHENTAFGLIFAWDYAQTLKDKDFTKLLKETSERYYLSDKDAPVTWEPDGDDFLSPSLVEADLMRRILPANAFVEWFVNYLPELQNNRPENLLLPAEVSDRSDPKIGHLDGLNLSRAWCMKGIANSLQENSSVRKNLMESAQKHAQATLPYINSGNYEGEHWLASFAVYLLSVN